MLRGLLIKNESESVNTHKVYTIKAITTPVTVESE